VAGIVGDAGRWGAKVKNRTLEIHKGCGTQIRGELNFASTTKKKHVHKPTTEHLGVVWPAAR